MECMKLKNFVLHVSQVCPIFEKSQILLFITHHINLKDWRRQSKNNNEKQ